MGVDGRSGVIGTDIIEGCPGLAVPRVLWCDKGIFIVGRGGVATGMGIEVGGWYVLGGNGGKL